MTGKKAVSDNRARLARDAEATIRLTVGMHGINLVTSEIQGNSRSVPHWRFLREDFVLLHYWPSNGRYRTADGASGILLDMHMAGTLARYMALETDPTEEAALQSAGALR